MSRLIMVSNRLPVTVRARGRSVVVERSAGGLASALRTQRRDPGDVWIGWPGSLGALSEANRVALDEQLRALGTRPVYLTDHEADLFYDGFSNGVLWPVFHYLTGLVPLRVRGWNEYRLVNARFADAVSAWYRPGDRIWIHDYHLMLLPQLLRQRLPDARIGFFLHTPFPTSELFAALPHRAELLRGLLGADLVGFHTASYRRHFESALERVLGLTTVEHVARHADRDTTVGVFPIGVDAAALERAAQQPEVAEEVARLRGDGSCRLLVGIDRLDYTKGIPRRLLALEDLLHRHPEWRGALRLIQVSVPSRESVGAYRRFRREVDSMVGHINGTFGTPHWMPVHYIFHSVSPHELLALYRAADAMLVTPIRDGMNLVAKEFAATRMDNDGVLLLSEFAGASEELQGALLVNPYDLELTAEAIHRALTMPADERRARMRELRQRVHEGNVHRWSARFLEALDDAAAATVTV